jgi:hypothetical protein
VGHGGQALSTGQVPAEFAMPKPDANMAEASEEADKMDTDGQNQESEADVQKQDDESTPIQEVVHLLSKRLIPLHARQLSLFFLVTMS